MSTEPEDDAYFRSDAVSKFLTILQEATRATPDGESQVYVPPPGADAINANYHHLVYGPRGSGKSTLLRKIERERREQSEVVAWVDQEVLSGLSFPDVLVSCVEAVMASAAKSVAAKGRSEKPSGYKGWFKRGLSKRDRARSSPRWWCSAA